ncbi:hypothetical protein SAMN02745165_02185 [Malonomonas rubra DSM 5091]|uniref:Porin n=1 Tax=Malonomonas rubra DSM 5091 TaxID=1122189 RepID=A0A1M6INJ6_MALRU|nr:hypothetical protein [Malonomonas rubra]SHJ36045.1 hypothetical protein SAMN02745165_02185 [Malonomonas rubra DSM 5091]
MKKLFLFCVFLLLPWQAFAFELADLHGFADLRAGTRLQEDGYQRDTSILEGRLQLDYQQRFDAVTLQLRGDLVADDVTSDHDFDLEEGTGFLDLREANLLFSPTYSMDVKIGRQILTWGTGDLLFINDMFPKDWQSFFIGRDEEYLKAPSDAAMISFFPQWATVDLVLTPRFDSDRYLSGQRISYWNPTLGRIAGRDAVINADQPDDWFEDYELASRVSKNIEGYELALYGYRGFWKSPVGYNADSGRAASTRLNVYGGSVRGSFRGGIFNVELGYYDSRADRDGDDAFQPNSEMRYLLGYERELAKELTGSAQFYLEQLLDYDEYKDSLPAGQKKRDQYRQVLTVRLTKLLMQQKLTASLFTYFSPTDKDFYLRPNVRYKLTDRWLVTFGGNLFGGTEDYTFFGQLEDNSNVYAGLRYSF